MNNCWDYNCDNFQTCSRFNCAIDPEEDTEAAKEAGCHKIEE